jgi:amino acid adenylation domain-containing protein
LKSDRKREQGRPVGPADGAAVDRIIAEVLGVPRSSLRGETAYRSIHQWDSLRHVELMLALEDHLGIEIGADLVTELNSVGAIRAFAAGGARRSSATPGDGDGPVLQRGLSGVYMDATQVSSIDGERGILTYRGYSIDELAEGSTYEECAYLLLHGRLPTPLELSQFEARLATAARLPERMRSVVAAMTDARPIDALRTGVSALAALHTDDGSPDELLEAGTELLGRVPALIVEHHARRSGHGPLDVDGLGHGARLLAGLTGRTPSAGHARIFDRCLILLAEHGSNASAFAGRVAISTQADIHAALTAAIATFAGPLHGGAIEGVGEMLRSIGRPERAAGWVRSQRARREPVSGFGHRLYRTEDPRARHLRAMAEELAREQGDMTPFLILEEVRRAMGAHARHGIDVNVDFYGGLVFSLLGIRQDLFTSVFAASRTAGWVAQALEQQRNNVLIRPLLAYAGEGRRPYVPLAERDVTPAFERSRMPMAGEAPRPQAAARGARLHSGFLESARRTPQATALRIGQQAWTYDDLDDIARRWASAVLDGLDRPARRIGVLGSRSEVTYAGVLAALFAGAAFVPLNSANPPARTAQMIRTAQLDAIIADRSALPLLAELLDGATGGEASRSDRPPLLLLPDSAASRAPSGLRAVGRGELRRARPLRAPIPTGADDMAYLLFTSGSTGLPKGVPISHANVTHFLGAAQERYRIVPEDRLSQTFEQTFDLSIFDLFMAWGSGASVCVPRPIDLLSPFRYVEENEISVWFSVPSLANLLRREGVLRPGSLPSLRWSLFCGEALSRETAEQWQAAASNSTLENLYGPTECTIACTAYRWHPERSPNECHNGLVPIGRPWDGVNVRVVDEELRPVQPGQAGELAVSGAQTFGGYWGDPAATERAFFSPPDDEAGGPYYRTGDRVKLLSSGDLGFIGRLDQQVQVRGHRVELGEVEAVLRSGAGVTDAAVVPWDIEAGNVESIAAFVSGHGLNADLLAASTRQVLPDYMAPRVIRLLDELPRNSNGKVDRSALRRLLEEPTTAA